MSNDRAAQLAQEIIRTIEGLIPTYLADPADLRISHGNVAICIIDETGLIHGRMYGNDKLRSRNTYRIAWWKASQVWITGMKTGEFEKQVFSGQLDEGDFGIEMPDYIGWPGGQPIEIDGSIRLSVGFSGFRGVSDLEIVQKAVRIVLGKNS